MWNKWATFPSFGFPSMIDNVGPSRSTMAVHNVYNVGPENQRERATQTRLMCKGC